jgi:hypothetical protein
MAFKKPVVKTIDADISKLSIYLRSVKKFGKSSLFKHMILAKYGDPEKGLLVEIGHEFGDTLLDNVNSTHVDTYKDFMELKKWLIEEKGNEHDIRIIGFDVVDEMIPAFENEVVRMHNIENPNKKVKSVKAAFGGYNAGVEMAASMIKEYMTDLKKAGFGVVTIAHTKMKPVKEKGSLEEDSYQMLTSNLQNAYESAFGDISDLVLTGYIDRNLETVGEGENAKKYATTEIRKLYFRGTSLIDAGSRFAPDAVPEYMIFDKMDMGEDFVRVIEDGIKNSKTITSSPKPTKTTKKTEPKPVVEETVDEIDDIDTVEETTTDVTADEIRTLFKAADKDTKAKVKEIIAEFGGKLDDADQDGLNRMHEILTA